MIKLKMLDSDQLTVKQKFGILKKNSVTTDFKSMFLGGQGQDRELIQLGNIEDENDDFKNQNRKVHF